MPTTPESFIFSIFTFWPFQVYLITNIITLKQTEQDKEKNWSVARDVENKEDDHQSNNHLHHNDQELRRKSCKKSVSNDHFGDL